MFNGRDDLMQIFIYGIIIVLSLIILSIVVSLVISHVNKHKRNTSYKFAATDDDTFLRNIRENIKKEKGGKREDGWTDD